MEALQYGALGLLGVVLAGVATGIKLFGLPLLREHLKRAESDRLLVDTVRAVLPDVGQNIERVRVACEKLADRADMAYELHAAIRDDVQWLTEERRERERVKGNGRDTRPGDLEGV